MSDTDPIEERDSNGRIIYSKESNGYEIWREYDSNGRVIHYKDSKGYEYWYNYDSNGNRIHYKDSNGNEIWYDENGHLTKDPVKILLLSQKLYSEASI